MKKLGNILLCGLFLTAIEWVILLVCFHVSNVIKYAEPLMEFGGGMRYTNELILLRIIFYFAPWVVGIWWLYPKINIRHPALKLAVMNCMLYVAISVLLAVFIPVAGGFFTRDFFFFVVAATFISPFILSVIPYFNKKVTKF